MNFDEAILEPHDLTCARLAAFCQYVGMTVADNTIMTLGLSGIVRVGQSNNLAPLDRLRGRMGVYAFQLDGYVIYVGMSGKGTNNWDLRHRIPQHLRRRDTGGTLRINWCRIHHREFADFENSIAESQLWVISFPNGEDIQKIARLEHLLIGLLGPEYCDVPAP